MEKAEIDGKYLMEAENLETEYFDVIELPSQHRRLKSGKSIDEFNERHVSIWHEHEAELLAGGFIQPAPKPEPKVISEPVRDLSSEIDALKTEIEKLKRQVGD